MNRMLLYVPRWVWLAFVATSIVFVAFPQIDLGVSRLFYTPGAGFEINGVWYERLIYYASEVLVTLVTLALIALWAYGRLTKGQRLPVRVSGRKLVVLLLVLALGPGLIINWALKEHWGRARPVDLVQFGGTQSFSPAWVISDQGGHSFCSGHAGATFYLIAVALIVSDRRRRQWLALAAAWGVLVGLTRIASGGHFLSDVLVAFFIVLILTLMLRGLILKENPDGKGAAAGLTETAPAAGRHIVGQQPPKGDAEPVDLPRPDGRLG
jgi:lipid A 4'-phosphatase